MKLSFKKSLMIIITLLVLTVSALGVKPANALLTVSKAMPAQLVKAVDACTAFNFTGSQYVTVADPGGTSLPKTASSNLTIETWVYPTDTSGVKSIVRWGTITHFYIANGTLYTEVWSDSNDPSTFKAYHSAAPATIPANQWTHVAMTWNGSAVKLYVNGVDESAVQTGSGTNSNAEAFHIGYSTVYGQGFTGNMDEFRIWNTARTASELLNNKDLPLVGNESGLVALFHFDDTVTTDAAGGDNTGTPTGATLAAGSLVPSTTCTPDLTAPTVDTFTATSPSTSLNIPITAFTASDAIGVTGYMITSSSTAPAAGAVGWSGSAPATFSVGSDGNYTLYPWAKDAIGNVSALFGSPRNVTVDTAAPAVNTFTVTSPSSSFNIPITAFTASDAIGVTGYMITESSTPPSAGAGGWAGSAPAIYTVASDGTYTLYPWAKDAIGNVSVVFGTPLTVIVNTKSSPAPAIFTDVPFSHWANGFVERLYNAHVTDGCDNSPMLYCPDATTTRAQMAIFILRSKYNTPSFSYMPPPATGTVFADVPLGAFADAWIEQLALEGITTGCGGGNYCPDASITRAEMAIFLLRGRHGSVYTPPAATGMVFTDVTAGSFAAAWIEQLAKEGITTGCAGGNYCPGNPVTRAEMAVFLVKAFGLP